MPMPCACVARDQDFGSDVGVTLIELLVVMAMIGILGALGTTAFSAVQRSLQARGANREVVTQLRTVQARAVAEDTAYCVDFSSSTSSGWRVYRVSGADSGALAAAFTCTSGTFVTSYTTPGRTTFTGVTFFQRNGFTTTYALLYARGAASGGSFSVGGDGGSNYTISVDQLTGRVTSTGA